MRFFVDSPSNMRDVASYILNNLKASDGATVLALSGDLGAGKTTFTQNLANILGILDTVNSPTFNILKKYKIFANDKFQHLIHIDAYRLVDSKDLLNLGFLDILNDTKNLIVIEWPERVSDILPEKAIKIEFQHDNIDSRIINIEDATIR